MFYAYDGLGSVAALSNHQGKLKTRYQYDAFGEVLTGDLSDNQYAFTGQRLDPESNLYHFHFRKYDAKVGVWTTADPIGVLGGVNLYQYVHNNPATGIDILGLLFSDPNETDSSPSAGELGIGNPGSYGGENTSESMYGQSDYGLAKNEIEREAEQIESAYEKALNFINDIIDLGIAYFTDGVLGAGGRSPKLKPSSSASGPHSTYNKNHWATWEPTQKGNSWQKIKSYDNIGKSHYNKATGEEIGTPHVHDVATPGGVRKPTTDEIPRSCD